MKQTIDAQIRRRIYGTWRGSVFTPANFIDLGRRAAVDKVLSRLIAEGALRRLARGLHDYPKIHASLGALWPEQDAVAKVIARRDAVELQPAGAYAVNLLGLSDVVPAKILYLTKGRAFILKLGAMEIELRHTVPRNTAMAGRLSGLLTQAFRCLRRDGVNTGHLEHLRQTIPAKERAKLPRELRYAPSWKHPLFR